jgi:hypothetical protein
MIGIPKKKKVPKFPSLWLYSDHKSLDSLLHPFARIGLFLPNILRIYGLHNQPERTADTFEIGVCDAAVPSPPAGSVLHRIPSCAWREFHTLG